MNKVAIFGYGSLLSKGSFEQTLGRCLSTTEFGINYLNGYARSWTLFHPIEYYPKEKRQLLPTTKKYIVYLDITPVENSRIVGSVVKVSNQELSKLDARERNYNRINVTNKLDSTFSDTVVYAYIGDDQYKTKLVPPSECVIIKEYVDIVQNGIEELNAADRADFWKTTISTEIDIVSIPGFYRKCTAPN